MTAPQHLQQYLMIGGRHILEWVANLHYETYGCFLSDRSLADFQGQRDARVYHFKGLGQP